MEPAVPYMDSMETKRELVKVAKIVREKYKTLKRYNEKIAGMTNQKLGPIIQPLKEIRDSIKPLYEKLSTNHRHLQPDDFSTHPTPKRGRALSRKSATADETPSRKRFKNQSLPFKKSLDFTTSTPRSHHHLDELTSDVNSEEFRLDEEHDKNNITLLKSEAAHTPEGEKTLQGYLSNFPPTIRPFLENIATGNTKGLDPRFGVRISPFGTPMMGSENVLIDNDGSIHVKGEKFEITQGLAKLLFLELPTPSSYSDDELFTYKKLLELTNAHKQQYSFDKKIASSSSLKYLNIIKPLFQAKKGGGMTTDEIRIEYFDDPNELVERLKILIGSTMAGNNAHQNEIESILEELAEIGIISQFKHDYR